jgi:hypothetical protein
VVDGLAVSKEEPDEKRADRAGGLRWSGLLSFLEIFVFAYDVAWRIEILVVVHALLIRF